MKIFIQLIMAFLIFNTIKSTYTELPANKTKYFYKDYQFYINLTNFEEQVETIYLEIMTQPKDYSLGKQSVSLLYLESNNISFSDYFSFNEIESFSFDMKRTIETHGTYYIFIYTYYYKFKIDLKNNTEYLLCKLPDIVDGDNQNIYLSFQIKLYDYKTKVVIDNNNNNTTDNKSNDNKIILYVISFVIIFLYIIWIVFVFKKTSKKNKSEINIPQNVDKSQILDNNIEVNPNNVQMTDYPNNGITQNYNFQEPDNHVNNYNNGTIQNYEDIQNRDYDEQDPNFAAPTPIIKTNEKPY